MYIYVLICVRFLAAHTISIFRCIYEPRYERIYVQVRTLCDCKNTVKDQSIPYFYPPCIMKQNGSFRVDIKNYFFPSARLYNRRSAVDCPGAPDVFA